MKRKLFVLSILVGTGYADEILPTDEQLAAPPNYEIISPNSYIQDPYFGQPMGRSTQLLTESQINATSGEGGGRGFWYL